MSVVATVVVQRAADFRQSQLDQKVETRRGFLDFLFSPEQKAIVTPQIAQAVGNAWASEAKLFEFSPVNPTIRTVRTSFPVVDQMGTSRIINVALFVREFSTYASRLAYEGNEISQAEEIASQMLRGVEGIKDEFTAEIEAIAEMLKTKVIKNDLGRGYEFAGDVLYVPSADRDDFLGDLAVIMKDNGFAGTRQIIGNGSLESTINRILQNGGQQAVNKLADLDGNMFYFDNALRSGAGSQLTCYAIAPATMSFTEQLSPLCLNGVRGTAGAPWDYDVMPLDMWGLKCNAEVLSREENGDTSGLNGNPKNKEDLITRMVVRVAGAFIYPSLPDDLTVPLPVLKTVVKTAAAEADTTAPTVSSVTSAATTSLTITFSEAVFDNPGQPLSADNFECTRADVTIVSATPSADNTAVAIVLGGATGTLAAGDKIVRRDVDGGAGVTRKAIVDFAGNPIVASDLAKVNAGATAWVVM